MLHTLATRNLEITKCVKWGIILGATLRNLRRHFFMTICKFMMFEKVLWALPLFFMEELIVLLIDIEYNQLSCSPSVMYTLTVAVRRVWFDVIIRCGALQMTFVRK